MLFYVIEQEQMVRKAWESVIKSSGHEFYTTEEVGDFKYIAEDMKPDAFICNSVTLSEQLDHFLSVFQESEVLCSLPIILIGDKISQLSNALVIKKPFNPLDTFPTILEFLDKGER